MKNKKVIITFFIMTTMFLMNSVVFASNVYVQLNGEYIDFTDEKGQRVDAQIVNERTMVPLRKIFELLGATVTWDDSTKTALAVKDDTTVKLQINNSIAEITKGNITKKVQLDSKPILINDRTMVPLRFISESLGKQVAWDSREQTAIIIDYNYFAQKIKEKSPILYKSLLSENQSAIIQISRNYYDLLNSGNNNISSVYATISNDTQDSQSILIDFTGTSELFNEIKNEGWSSIGLNIKYDETGFTYSSAMSILNKMLPQNQYTYDEIDLNGKYNDSFEEAMKNFFGVDEDKINITTFAKMKNDFENFISLFNTSNTATTSIIKNKKFTSTSNNILCDYATFDNIIFGNTFSKSFNIINKLFFNYDVTFDELLYDYSTIDLNIQIEESNGSFVSIVTITLLNDFNEKIVYNIKIVN